MDVVSSIYNEPEKWSIGDNTFNHVDGARVWISNIPLLDTNMHPSIYMTWRQKYRIYKAIKWWSSNAPMSAFKRV